LGIVLFGNRQEGTMPKGTEYTIVWSEQKQHYEVRHGALTFDLAGDIGLQGWLDFATTFHFCSPTGQTLTLRKERKQRGSGYWYAYKRVGGRVHKKYLGCAENITLRLLADLACTLAEPAAQQPPPVQPPPRVPTLKFEKTLESALSIYGFSSLPNRRALIERYRQLCKQHHPDVGGLHQDMVAVNLAYEYLKRLVNDRR
jgi:hypothetical protein